MACFGKWCLHWDWDFQTVCHAHCLDPAQPHTHRLPRWDHDGHPPRFPRHGRSRCHPCCCASHRFSVLAKCDSHATGITQLGILAHSFPPSRGRSVAFATFAAGAPVGGAFGTIIGGVLTQLSKCGILPCPFSATFPNISCSGNIGGRHFTFPLVFRHCVRSVGSSRSTLTKCRRKSTHVWTGLARSWLPAVWS